MGDYGVNTLEKSILENISHNRRDSRGGILLECREQVLGHVSRVNCGNRGKREGIIQCRFTAGGGPQKDCS